MGSRGGSEFCGFGSSFTRGPLFLTPPRQLIERRALVTTDAGQDRLLGTEQGRQAVCLQAVLSDRNVFRV